MRALSTGRLSLSLITATTGLCFLVYCSGAAAAEQAPPPSISVTETGYVSYAPDVAEFTVGVLAESPDAATAAKSVNTSAQAVIKAIQAMGIPGSAITTSDYNIQYRVQPQPTPAPAGEVSTQSTMRKAMPAPGTYIATESLDVQTPIDKAGDVLDAAIAAGANESGGMNFDTTQRHALYRQAMANAVVEARTEALALAKAAGVSLAGVQTIQVGEPSYGPRILGTVRFASETGGVMPPIQGGTATISATVTVVYRIK